MKKTLSLLMALAISATSTIAVVACEQNGSSKPVVNAPAWLYAVNQNLNNFSLTYQNHYIASPKGYNDDWINLSTNDTMYLTLPKINDVSDVINNRLLTFSDSDDFAFGHFLPEPISFHQISENSYGSNAFMVQDFPVAGVATIGEVKYQDILHNKVVNSLNDQQHKEFAKTGSITVTGANKNDWWNSNGWESLLKSDIQRFNYANVKGTFITEPLSLVAPDSIKIEKTSVSHTFAIKIDLSEQWIDDHAQRTVYAMPHWGLSASINYNIVNNSVKAVSTPIMVENMATMHNYKNIVAPYLKDNFNSVSMDANLNKLPWVDKQNEK